MNALLDSVDFWREVAFAISIMAGAGLVLVLVDYIGGVLWPE